MAVPYTFGTATSSIPLSQLDSNFSTPITIGNTAVQLGNTVVALNNMTFANVTISSVASAITPAQGGTGLVAVGTTGNVLTSNGSAWISSAPSSTSGSLNLISTLTVSGTPTALSWTGLTGYNNYLLVIDNILMTATDNVSVQVGTGATPTWLTSGTYHNVFGGVSNSSTAANYASLNGVFSLMVNLASSYYPLTTGSGTSASLLITGMTNSQNTLINGTFTYQYSGSNYAGATIVGGVNNTTAKTAIRVTNGFNGSTLASGTASLYGITS